MASVKVQIDGVFWPHSRDGRSKPIKGTMMGDAHIYGLGVGGGPIIPPEGGGGGDEGPVDPGWGIPEGGRPSHPIVIPDPPDPPQLPPGTPPNTVVKTAPEGGWGYYTNETGALYSAYNPGSAGPKK